MLNISDLKELVIKATDDPTACKVSNTYLLNENELLSVINLAISDSRLAIEEPNWRNNFKGYGSLDKYLLSEVDPGVGEVQIGESVFYTGDDGKRYVRIRD